MINVQQQFTKQAYLNLTNLAYELHMFSVLLVVARL